MHVRARVASPSSFAALFAHCMPFFAVLLAVPWDVKEVSAAKRMERRLAEVEVRLDALEDDLRAEKDPKMTRQSSPEAPRTPPHGDPFEAFLKLFGILTKYSFFRTIFKLKVGTVLRF